VLGEIGASDKRSVVVFNKVDTIDEGEAAALQRRYPAAVLCSALDRQGIDDLLGRIAAEAARDAVTMTVLLPYTRGDLVRLAHERAQIVSEHHTELGTELGLRVPAELAQRFAEYDVLAGEADPQ
jgi:GTP-binding protein HflX